ncbi:MAG: MCE family protein [Deltaproteobacteria bacterium]|nr:MAG: MCE family protein [Deltaproteobacteria bacterium]
MASQRTKLTVGLFLVSGITIAVIAFVWLGMSRFLQKGNFYVTYFNESVQGLDIDSSVKYRGVPVGRVERIEVAPDSKLIKVVLKIESGQALNREIVAQLKSVGITGAMFIELDRLKKGEPDRSPPLSFPSEYPIVASKPSDISQLLQGIDDVLGKINRVDFEGIAQRLKNNLDRIEQTIADADVKGLVRSVEASLGSVRRILADDRWQSILAGAEQATISLNSILEKGNSAAAAAEKVFANAEGILADKQQTIRSTFDQLSSAIENANNLMEKGSSLVAGADDTVSHLKKNLVVTVQNLAHASESLNRLIELLMDQPSQLLLGDAPLPRKIELDTGKTD